MFDPVSAINAIKSVLGAFQAIGLFKGKTGHPEYDICNSGSVAMTDKLSQYFETTLSDSEKKIFTTDCSNDLNKSILSYLRTTSDYQYSSTYDSRNRLANDLENQINSYNGTFANFRVGIFNLMFWLISQSDSARSEDMNVEIINKWNNFVLPIINKYISVSSNAVSATNDVVTKTGANTNFPNTQTSTNQASLTNWKYIILFIFGIGIVWGLLKAKGKESAS